MLTDPCLFNLPGIKRFASLPTNANNLKGIDYVLLSHGHRDHLDKKSLKVIYKNNPEIKSLVPLRTTRLISNLTKNVEEAGWYQRFSTKENINIYFLPAHHWNRRGLTDFNKTLWGSFLIQANNKTIYFAGDTGEGNHFEEIAKLFPNINYALMPIGAYKPQFLMKMMHTSPEDSVNASNVMGIKNFIPMHYGTYVLSDEPIGEPIRELKKMEKENKIKSKVHYLKVGEELKF